MALVAPRHPTLSSGPSASPSGNNDAGDDDSVNVMHEILEELDRERSKRAELEAKFVAIQKQKELGDEITISRKHYLALQTELKGLRDLVDAITRERPAIREAVALNTRKRMVPPEYEKNGSNNNKQPPTLPLHMVRVLEIMPWDPRATEYAFAEEAMYEWQFYDSRQKVWLNEIRSSPKFFRDLPTEEPNPCVNSEESSGNQPGGILRFLVGNFSNNETAPPSSCVLTNHSITKLYNLQRGFPLPENGGTWQWVGGWRVEKKIEVSELSQRIDCDDDGWSYAMEPTHFLLNPAETCWDNPGAQHDKKTGATILRPVRRRKWTRQRTLVEYPYASESTKCFLTLLAQRMYATITANKVSEQLVETKVALTESESVLVHCKDETSRMMTILVGILNAKGKKERITNEDTRSKIAAVSDAANQMQIEIVKALSFASREKNCPSSPL